MPGKLDPTSDRPIYKQIADQLRSAIESGEYPPGEALPSEAALSGTFAVTRMTVRQALDVLKAEGLVRSEHGRGVFVRERPQVRSLRRSRFDPHSRESGRGACDVEMRRLGLGRRGPLPGIPRPPAGLPPREDRLRRRLQASRDLRAGHGRRPLAAHLRVARRLRAHGFTETRWSWKYCP